MTTTIPTGEITFSTVSSLTTCSQVTIAWTYNGNTPTFSTYPLVVTNIGIDRLHHRELPLVPRQVTTAINMTLSQISPLMLRLIWPQVNVPQGWYRLDAYTSTQVVSSNVFPVTNGIDVSCVVVSSQSSIPLSSTPSTDPTSTPFVNPTSIPSPSSSTSSTNGPSVTSPALVSGISSAKKGIIVGGVFGGLAVLALIAVVALWAFRRRKTIVRNATPPGSAPRTKGPSRALHKPSDSTGAILPLGGGNQENSPQVSTSEEDFVSEKFATAFGDINPNSPPIAATRPHSKSLSSSRRPVSMTIHTSFKPHEMVQPKPSRQSRRSLDSNVTSQNKTIPPSPSSPSHARHPSDRTRRASRKPVPVYDPTEFPGSETNDTSLSGRSETGLGGGKGTYYLVPDAPLEQRK